MKYILSILLVITTNVYAQTKDTSWTSYNKEGIISVEYENIDNPYHRPQNQIQAEWYLDTVPIKRFNNIDSAKVYWKKKVYWENKMQKEIERLDRTGHKNDISKNLVRFQDSAIRYKILLDKLKR